MKECTKEQLDWILEKHWIRLGTFEFGKCSIKFAANIVKDAIYLTEDYNQIPFGYEYDENGKVQSFSYDNIIYMLSHAIREKVTAPITKRLTTTTAVYDVVAKNADSRALRQTEAALAFLVFSTLKDFAGEDLTDTETGSHILPDSLIVEPDTNPDLREPSSPDGEQEGAPDASQNNGIEPKADKSRKNLILQFRAKK